MSISLTGEDTTIINGRILRDLADGDCVAIDVPNNIAEQKIGKNGNILVAFNATGKTVNVTIRVIAGSADDKFLNSEYASFINDPASFPMFEGEFIKRVGDGSGNVNNIVYSLGKGVPQKMPVVKENKEGDTEQSVAIWMLQFANTDRAIE
jgi:hypothetical protein